MIDVAFYIKDLSVSSGINLYVSSLSRELVKRGINVEVIADIEEGECPFDVPIHILGTKLDILRLIRLAKYIDSKKPKVLISNIPARNPILVFLKKIYDDLKICSVYHLPVKRWNPFKVYIANKFNYTIAVSENVYYDVKKNTKCKNIYLIENPFDFERILKMSEESVEPYMEEIFKERKVIINVGRIEYQKGIDILIDVFKIIKSKCNKAFLLIIGDGKERGRIEEKIRIYGLDRDILIRKPLINPYKYIKRSCVFAFTSRYESLGRVVVESLFLGTPVIGFSSTGDYVEILKKYNSCVPFGNLNLFAEKLLSIMEKGSINKEINSLKDSLFYRYSADKIAEKFISHFHPVLKGRKDVVSFSSHFL